MSKANEPAFARPFSHNTHWDNPVECKEQSGLTKRELFAAMSLQGLLSVPMTDSDVSRIAHLTHAQRADLYAKSAVSYADALLAELEKDGDK